MIREIKTDNFCLQYELTLKRVKNINLRVKTDKKVYVSAPFRVNFSKVDEFVISKIDFIVNVQKKVENCKIKTEKQFSLTELNLIVCDYSKYVYNLLESYKITFPQIKFRKMKTRWGSCNYKKCKITFNTSLCYLDKECIYYIVCHEFSHLIAPNHSKNFYNLVEKICPNYKVCQKKIKNIFI